MAAVALVALLVAAAAPRLAPVVPALALAVVLVRAHTTALLAWPTLVGALVVLVLVLPIRRYVLPAGVPVDLEPYRIAVALVLAAWGASLLVQPDEHVSLGGLGAPLVGIAAAIGLSIAANAGAIGDAGLSPEVVKGASFLASYVLVAAFAASTLRTRADREAVVVVLAGGGTLVAVLALVESRTGFNPFDHLQGLVPELRYRADGFLSAAQEGRGGRLRVRASAQHPIALGAALVLLVPLALHLARRRRSLAWVAAAALLVLGALATVSRTAMVMLLAEVVVFAVLRPRTARRLWPALLPLVLVVHLATPGVLGAFKGAFFPKGGIVAQQRSGAATYGSGRLADLEPGLREWSRTPLAGQGYGTRITQRTDPKHNAPILDDQWLGLLLTTGAAGVAAFAWLFARAVRRLGRRSHGRDAEADLALALAAATLAFAVGMATYDAFSFVQVTFLLFLLLGLGGALLGAPQRATQSTK